MTLVRPQAILFDMGGVLQDAAISRDAASWQRSCPPGVTPPDDVEDFLALAQHCLDAWLALPVPRPAVDPRPRIARWIERKGQTPSPEAVERLFRLMQWAEVQPVYPFVKPTLERLLDMGLRLGVISNSFLPGDALREHFRRAGILDLFEFIVWSGDFGMNKPHPSIFRHALEAMRLEAHAAWFVGDKPQRDVCGAHAVGMTAVLVDGLYAERVADAPENLPDLRIGDIRELPDVVEQAQQPAPSHRDTPHR